ncbi:MAG: ATP/GTP-binding protein [Archaeoglobaceae archaeon]
MNLIVMGPAGGGKSTFVKAYSHYLGQKGYQVKVVNLDPASEPIYPTSANIRDFVKTEEVMKAYGLGINGALLKSMELAVEYVERLTVEGEFVLYDTPGQMELFLYSEAGNKFIKEIASDPFTVGLFIVDCGTAADPENFVSILAQNTVVSLRTALPTLTVFNKIDLQNVEHELDLNVESVKKDISRRGGVLAELLEGLLVFVEQTTVNYRPLKVSSTLSQGFEEVFHAVNEVFCSCGDIS